MKKILTTALAFCLITIASNSIAAPFTNGDFETGTLDGWLLTAGTSTGEATVVNAPDVMTNNYAMLNDLDSSGIASIYQTFDIDPSATTVNIAFDYYFAGQDNTDWYSDVIWSTVAFKTGDNFEGWCDIFDWEIKLIGVTDSSGGLNTKASVSVTYDISLVDEYPNAMLQFGLWESNAWCFADQTDTWLGVDNITVSSSTAPIPEPATMLLFGTGMAGLLGISKRRKKQQP